MSEQNYEAEAHEIAKFLDVEFRSTTMEGEYYIGDALFYPEDAAWHALLRLARQPRGLPAEVPEGHERVRVGLRRRQSERGWVAWSEHEAPSLDNAHAIITADVPVPRAVEIVGSVEPNSASTPNQPTSP